MHAHPSSRSAGRSPVSSMAITWASAVVPGLAHWVSGRRRSAVVIFSLALALLIGVVWLALTTSRTELLRMAVRPGSLTVVIVVALAVAVAWVVLVTGSYRVLGPVRQTGLAQVGVILGLAVLSLLVAAPPVAVARYAYLQRDLVTNLFPDDDPNSGLAAGQNGGGGDAFGGRSRVTILLLASDAGPDRTGTRTDSMVAASIDTHTGDVILFSLPRNLQNVALPPGPLREQWPHGFPDLLNGVYQFVTNQPHLLAGARDRGAAAIKSVVSYILGIPIDYYAMVNLEGFNEFVDAMGGVTIDVTQRLPIGGLLADGTRVPPVGYIEPGVQHLNGSLAQWYARSRRDGTDYDRMLRQRCLIGAMVQQATPVNVLKHFQELSSATKRLAETDIPRSVLPDLITLGDKMHGGSSLRSVAFVPPIIHTGNPDYAKIRRLVKDAINPPKPADPGTSATPSAPPKTSAAPKPASSASSGTASAPAAGNGSPVDVKSACALG
jgi:polyisoprenyl-teichoic acid--peptidoglycan teichoic acid transferase